MSKGKVYKKKRSNFELKAEASSKVLVYNFYRETLFEKGQWHPRDSYASPDQSK